MSDFDLMTVREMIDSTFGEIDSSCPVDFNMLGSVLYILARRMQLLKRHFKVQVSMALANKGIPKTSFKLTEIKIHAKKKGRSTKVYPMLADDILTSDKILAGKMKRSTRKHSRKTALHRSPLGKRLGDASSSGISSDGEVSTAIKSKAHRHPSKKYTSERRAARTSDRRKGEEDDDNDVSSGARRKSGKYFDENPAAKLRKHKKYSDKISPTERHRTGKYSDEMSTSERRNFGKYYDEMSPKERRKAGKYSDEMSSTGRRQSGKYTGEMSPDERKKIFRKISPTGQRRGGKYSDQKSTSERSGSGKYYSPSDELSSESATSRRSRSYMHGGQRGKADAELYSQKDTAGRSIETGGYGRKIRRHDARHADGDDYDTEEQHEKIYVVTRTPSGREIRDPVNLHPVVTQEQFSNLLARTRELNKKFGITSKPTQWDDLRNTNFITNPKAALNISVRLDEAETRLKRMLDVLEQIARQVPGLNVQGILSEKSLPPQVPGLNVQGILNEKSLPPDKRRGPVSTPLSETPRATMNDNRDEYFQTLDTEFDYDTTDEPEPAKLKNMVTQGQFNDESKRLRDGIVRTMRKAIDDAGLNNRLSISSTEVIVAQLHNKFKEIVKLDCAIEEFGKEVVAIDEHLTFETTNIQDNLMHMQVELETALEKMNEALLAPKEDAAAVAQITIEFNEYIKDLDRTERIQIELKRELEVYLQNLKNLEERTKTLRSRKCTRDEMFEALNDKLTLRDINGILTEDQFGAVNAEMKGTLQNLFLTIFTKECNWQRIIVEVQGKLYDCADTNQIVTLNESIRKCFTKMDKDVDDLFEILGPLKKSITNKKIERDDNCLSCGAPAAIEKNKLSVKLWHEMISTDAVKPIKLRAEEIADLCLPGQPITHPLDLERLKLKITEPCSKLPTDNDDTT